MAILPIAIAIRAIPDGTGKNAPEVAHGEAKGLPVWHDVQLLLIGVIVLAMAFAEGSANDWLPLLMVDGHGFSPPSGSLIYAGFTFGMTLGHFTGGWFIDRYRRVAVVRGSAVMGALGIRLIIFVDNPWVAGISVLLWGIGASLGFPLTISAASDTGPARKRVSVVAITGYLSFLVGPPLLGFLGEHFGLRSAMMVVLGLVMVAALVARAVAYTHNLNPLWRTANQHQTDCGGYGRHLFKRCQNLQPAALPRPVPANARTEYSLRGRQRQPILSADLLFPGDRP